MFTLNFHVLCHLPDVLRYLQCSALDVSAYPFESFLGVMSRRFHGYTLPTEQISNRLSELSSAFGSHSFQPSIPSKFSMLSNYHNQLYYRDMYGGYFYRLDFSDGFFRVQYFTDLDDFFSIPCSSSTIGIVTGRLCNEITFVPESDIAGIVWGMAVSASVFLLVTISHLI